MSSRALIPDYLALVGDAADGFPGIPGIGAVTAARLLNRYGGIESFPSDVLREGRDLALLFKDLATLRTDADVFATVDDLTGTARWKASATGRNASATPIYLYAAARSSANMVPEDGAEGDCRRRVTRVEHAFIPNMEYITVKEVID